MRPYTKEGLEREQQQSGGGHRSERSKAADASGGVGGRSTDQVFYPDSYYHYKLAGVLVHMGTADSGHYYSYIKQRDTQARKDTSSAGRGRAVIVFVRSRAHVRSGSSSCPCPPDAVGTFVPPFVG